MYSNRMVGTAQSKVLGSTECACTCTCTISTARSGLYIANVCIYMNVYNYVFIGGGISDESLSLQRCAPASIRLMDNFQFQLGKVSCMHVHVYTYVYLYI